MLNSVDQKRILSYSRELLKAHLTHGPEPKLDLGSGFLDEKRGIFVTLKSEGHLRGCIGQILGFEPLRKSLRDMTLAAAFRDPRFPPLVLRELPAVKIHISLLTEPAAIKSYKDIRIGIDGIIVTYGREKGVYLPEVATETGWNARTFFESCALEKAGLTESELAGAEIEVFQTEGFEDDESERL